MTYIHGELVKQGPPSDTMDPIQWTLDPIGVPAKWHLNPSNGLSRVRKCDRQTDHAMKKCVAIGGIACTAGAMPHKSGTTFATTLEDLKLPTKMSLMLKTWLLLQQKCTVVY